MKKFLLFLIVPMAVQAAELPSGAPKHPAFAAPFYTDHARTFIAHVQKALPGLLQSDKKALRFFLKQRLKVVTRTLGELDQPNVVTELGYYQSSDKPVANPSPTVQFVHDFGRSCQLLLNHALVKTLGARPRQPDQEEKKGNGALPTVTPEEWQVKLQQAYCPSSLVRARFVEGARLVKELLAQPEFQ